MAKIARNAQFTARSRVCVARRAGLSLIPAPLATAPAVEGLAAERATGIGPGAAAKSTARMLCLILMQRAEYSWISSPNGPNDNVNQLMALARELLGTPKNLQLTDGDTDAISDGAVGPFREFFPVRAF
jgi:hypothetical protein